MILAFHPEGFHSRLQSLNFWHVFHHDNRPFHKVRYSSSKSNSETWLSMDYFISCGGSCDDCCSEEACIIAAENCSFDPLTLTCKSSFILEISWLHLISTQLPLPAVMVLLESLFQTPSINSYGFGNGEYSYIPIAFHEFLLLSWLFPKSSGKTESGFCWSMSHDDLDNYLEGQPKESGIMTMVMLLIFFVSFLF